MEAGFGDSAFMRPADANRMEQIEATRPAKATHRQPDIRCAAASADDDCMILTNRAARRLVAAKQRRRDAGMV